MNPFEPSPLRRTPIARGRSARAKGGAGEREVVEILRAHGWPRARRNFGSGSQGGGDLLEGPVDVSWEIKRCETVRIWQWLTQLLAAARPTDLPVLVFRRNRSRWWAAVPLEDLLALLREREGGSGPDPAAGPAQGRSPT
jgi:hypothetical protein